MNPLRAGHSFGGGGGGGMQHNCILVEVIGFHMGQIFRWNKSQHLAQTG